MSSRFHRIAGIEVSAMQDESILFDPASSRFCLLNQTAAFIWERLESPATEAELAAAVCDAFDAAEPAQVVSDVRRTLTQLTDFAFVAIAGNAE